MAMPLLPIMLVIETKLPCHPREKVPNFVEMRGSSHESFPDQDWVRFVIRGWPSRPSEPLVSRPIIAQELSLLLMPLTEPHTGTTAVLVDELERNGALRALLVFLIS
jgi:hypothetical protein